MNGMNVGFGSNELRGERVDEMKIEPTNESRIEAKGESKIEQSNERDESSKGEANSESVIEAKIEQSNESRIEVKNENVSEAVERVKAKLRELFEQVIDYVAETKVDSVAIFIDWSSNEPVRIEFEGNVGICECGNWVTICESCHKHELDELRDDYESRIYDLEDRIDDLERELDQARDDSSEW